jgi:methyl-accepting chemotaxis protein
VIDRINELQASIAGAVHEQTATTSSMAFNVKSAADSVLAISESIRAVGTAAVSTRDCAVDTSSSADQLVRTSGEIQRLLTQFTL